MRLAAYSLLVSLLVTLPIRLSLSHPALNPGSAAEKTVLSEREIQIQSKVKIARYLHYKYGVPASVQIAQYIQETGGGTSMLSRNHNNEFGVKCFKRRCKAGHCVQYHDDRHDDRFRIYSSKEASWQHHARILANGRYKKLLRHGNNWRSWCVGLQKAGYATDRGYASSLISIIQQYGLERYDDRADSAR